MLYKKIWNNIFYTIKCTHVPKCWNGAAYMKSKPTCIFVSSVSTALQVLKQHESPNIFPPKNDLD